MSEVDQAQESKGGEEAQTTSGASTSDDAEAKSSSQDEGKSTDENQTSGTYLVDDVQMSADDLYKSYQDLKRDYTKRTEKLLEYEKSMSGKEKELGTSAKSVEAARSASKEIAEQVPPDVRDAVVAIMEPEIERRLNERFNQFSRTQQQTAEIKRSFDRLEQNWDGTDGKPKFDPEADKKEIVSYMEREGKVFDPEIAYEQLHKDEINDWRVKQALRKSSGGRKTEKTGGGEKKPKRKTPKTLAEASEATLERLRNAL